jgi:hypothetical protein
LAIEEVIEGRVLKMNTNDVIKPQAVNHGVEVFTKITDYRSIIETTCG